MKDLIIIDQSLLDEVLNRAKENPRLRMNFDLRDSTTDTSQRMLNAFQPYTRLPIHRHKTTAETILLIQGSIDEVFYNENGYEIQRFHLNCKMGIYGLNIPAGVWHNAIVHEPSVILTIKDGAYQPTSEDDILHIW